MEGQPGGFASDLQMLMYGELHNLATHLLPRLLEPAMNRRAVVRLLARITKRRAEPASEFISGVADIAEAHPAALVRIDDVAMRVYNVGTGHSSTYP